jgi:hypothetical protein
MVYGLGFASADDVVAHEMTHGVTEYESGLFYINQSGAINESFSDIWGEFVDLTNAKGNDTAPVKWFMGEDLPIGEIRDMSDPTQFGDPDRMRSENYWNHECDNGGVHINSGIGNKAAFLMTDGGSFNGVTVTGLGIEKVAKIFYEAQTNLLTSGSDYNDLANALQQACESLIGAAGITALDCQEVANAISATEMDQTPRVNVLNNPGFENGKANWIENSSPYYDIIAQDPFLSFCSSNWFAGLGGYDSVTQYIYQDVTLPSNATKAYLRFAYAIYTLEYATEPYDTLTVEVVRPSDHVVLQTLRTFSNADDTGLYYYFSVRYDLSSYIGQTIRLRFSASTDEDLRTYFLVDDIVLAVLLPPGQTETISTPNTPSGPATGAVQTSYSFTTGGSSSNLGDPIQYLFEWGDGTNSGWLAAGVTSTSKSWASGGTYLVKAQARCATHSSAVSLWSGSLSVNIETVSTPTTPGGPTTGIPGTSYSYSAGGSFSNFGDSVQYFFDWGDGTKTDWLPVGTTSASHSWTSVGTYLIKVQARCAIHTFIVSSWSEAVSVNISSIVLQSPADGSAFNPCSLMSNYQPSFQWVAGETLKRYTIIFSTSPTDFATTGVVINKASGTGTTKTWKPSSFVWKKILQSSDNLGTIRDVYWKVVGTKTDGKLSESDVRRLRIGNAQSVTINLPASGEPLFATIPPTFNFAANCNKKFTLEFSPLIDFSDPKKIKAVTLSITNPNVQTIVQKTLSSFQWNGIVKLLGAGGYFRIKAWDALNRLTIEVPRNFSIN